MADFVVTPANVLKSSNGTTIPGVAGATLAAGDALYLAANGTYQLAKANGASPINTFAGIALNAATSGQPVLVLVADTAFTPGFTVAAGATVILSGTTAGKLAPVADNASGWFNTIVGVGIGSNQIKFSTLAAGVAT